MLQMLTGKHLSKQLHSFFLQLVCVCISEWIQERVGEQNKFLCVFMCVCAESSVCMMDGEGSTLHVADKYTFANSVCTLGWREQCHTVCASVWPHCPDCSNLDVVWFSWGPRSLLSPCWFQNHLDSEIWFLLWLALTWNVEWFGVDFDLEWFDLEWAQSLIKIRVNCIFIEYLELPVRVHDINQKRQELNQSISDRGVQCWRHWTVEITDMLFYIKTCKPVLVVTQNKIMNLIMSTIQFTVEKLCFTLTKHAFANPDIFICYVSYHASCTPHVFPIFKTKCRDICLTVLKWTVYGLLGFLAHCYKFGLR